MRLLEGEFDPRFLFAFLGRLGSPGLGSKLSVIDIPNAGAGNCHPRWTERFGADTCEGQILVSIPIAENFDFVQPNSPPVESDSNFLGCGWCEMEFLVSNPVFFPRSNFDELSMKFVDLSVQLPATNPSGMIFREFRKTPAEFDILKDSRHRVVITNRDWIEFMIVATGATNRHTHRRGAHRLKNFIHSICPRLSSRGGFLADGRNRDVRS